MEVLQCYNPHRTEGFCTIGVLQRCYRGATGCYTPWPEGAETAETLTAENGKNAETLTAKNAETLTARNTKNAESLRAKESPGDEVQKSSNLPNGRQNVGCQCGPNGSGCG
jgi:hypothetical protein